MKITPFHPSHFGALIPAHESQRQRIARVTPEYLADLATEPAITIWIEGRPVAVAGVLGNCELWCVLDEATRHHRLSMFKAARRFVSTFGWLYANVDCGFDQGCQLLRHLGFVYRGEVEVAGVKSMRYERVA